MSELKLPTQITVDIDDGDKVYVVYMAGDNPQQDGAILYRSVDRKVKVIVNPRHKAAWP